MDPIIASKNPKLKILGNTVLRNLLALFSFNDLNAAGVTMDTKKIIDPNNNEKIIDDMFIFFPNKIYELLSKAILQCSNFEKR